MRHSNGSELLLLYGVAEAEEATAGVISEVGCKLLQSGRF